MLTAALCLSNAEAYVSYLLFGFVCRVVLLLGEVLRPAGQKARLWMVRLVHTKKWDTL